MGVSGMGMIVREVHVFPKRTGPIGKKRWAEIENETNYNSGNFKNLDGRLSQYGNVKSGIQFYSWNGCSCF
jgi:hypothetical protein